MKILKESYKFTGYLNLINIMDIRIINFVDLYMSILIEKMLGACIE